MNRTDSKIRKKRNRKFLVCAECRRKKIKCDRKQPCSHCIKAGLVCEFKAPNGSPCEPIEVQDAVEGEMIEDSMDIDGSISSAVGPELAAVDILMSGDPSGGNGTIDGSPLSTPPGLQAQIDELKQKLAQITERVQEDNARSSLPSILDVKLASLKRSGVACKPSRTVFVGPTSRYCLVFSRPMFRYMISSLRNVMNDERRAWKKLHHGSEHTPRFSADAIDEEVAVGLIQRLICSNYYAFQERLVYFQTNLNHLLYSSFVPMDVIHSLFLARFHDPDQNGVAIFSRPLKCYFYADISAIVSIVYLVVIFTRYNSQNDRFAHRLLIHDTDQLSSLALNLLNLSEYRRKKTQLALLTLIILRSALFVHDNPEGANEEVNSYPIFQMSLDMSYQMGIHMDPDSINFYMFKDKLTMKARGMSPIELRELWNYLQTEDAIYSFTMGTPILIRYDFCTGYKKKSHCFFEDKRADGVAILREIALEINSLKPICMRDVLRFIDKVTLYLYELPFKMFCVSDDDLDDLANLCRLKLLFLQALQCLCRMIIIAVSDLYKSKSPVLQDKETVSLLNSLCEEMYREALLAAASSLYIMRDICDGRTLFGNEKDGKYIVFFRDLLARGMGQGFILWFTCLLAKATKNAELITELANEPLLADYPPDSTFDEDVTVYTIEVALYHRYTGKDAQYCESLSSKLVRSPTLMTFASSLYDVVSKNMVMRNSLDSFMILKLVIMWLYVLQTVQECENELDRKAMSVADIMAKTKEKVESGFNLGRLDENLKLNADEYQLEKVFDSMFMDQNWLNLPANFEFHDGASVSADGSWIDIDGEKADVNNVGYGDLSWNQGS
ncbi:DEKNAAC101831 [Brettanomyces naardenensis]|uniref:DEKNAAC101831 n=1 Tax=Brettanomyces naardenensis TaxID=13370 RepID=A0A448YJ56_BRENA|nr:DEKNAAC101831 [Brettanomyces naardenensis]